MLTFAVKTPKMFNRPFLQHKMKVSDGNSQKQHFFWKKILEIPISLCLLCKPFVFRLTEADGRPHASMMGPSWCLTARLQLPGSPNNLNLSSGAALLFISLFSWNSVLLTSSLAGIYSQVEACLTPLNLNCSPPVVAAAGGTFAVHRKVSTICCSRKNPVAPHP